MSCDHPVSSSTNNFMHMRVTDKPICVPSLKKRYDLLLFDGPPHTGTYMLSMILGWLVFHFVGTLCYSCERLLHYPLTLYASMVWYLCRLTGIAIGKLRHVGAPSTPLHPSFSFLCSEQCLTLFCRWCVVRVSWRQCKSLSKSAVCRSSASCVERK